AGPGIPVRPVVKADAYGHGAVPIALALEGSGADGFCVAAIDAPLELPGAGVRGPILVLYPVPVAWVGEAVRLGISVARGDIRALAHTARPRDGLGAGRAVRHTRWRRHGRSASISRARPVSGGAGCRARISSRRPGSSRTHRVSCWPGCGPISR